MTNSHVIEYFNSRAGEVILEPGPKDVIPGGMMTRMVPKSSSGTNTTATTTSTTTAPPVPSKMNAYPKLFQEDIEEFREPYKQASSIVEKKEVAHQLLARMKERGGYFLKNKTEENKKEQGKQWLILNYEESSLRVRQILRESTGKAKLLNTNSMSNNHNNNNINSSNNNSNNNVNNKTNVVSTGTITNTSLTPRISRGTLSHHPQQQQQQQQQQHQQHFSTEYLDACKLFSDITMKHACELLLDTSSQSNAKEQLLQLYQKCVQAAHIIETHVNHPSSTGAISFPLPPFSRGGRNTSIGGIHNTTTTTIPHSSSTTTQTTTTATTTTTTATTTTGGGSGSSSGGGGGTNTTTMLFPKTKTIIPPLHRTRVLHPSEFPHRGSIMSQSSNSITTASTASGGSNYNHSNSSNNNNSMNGVKASAGVVPPTKKLKRATSPTSPTPPLLSTTTISSSSSSVPENALQFLAKLNKERDQTNTTTTTNNNNNNNSDVGRTKNGKEGDVSITTHQIAKKDQLSVNNTSTMKKESEQSTTPAVRIQPSRSSKKS